MNARYLRYLIISCALLGGEAAATAEIVATLSGPTPGEMKLQITFGPLSGALPAELIFAEDESGMARTRGYAQYDGKTLGVEDLLP